MSTEWIYNKQGKAVGAIDPIYSKYKTRYSAIVFTKKSKDDHEKEFNTKSEARKYINQQNLIEMATKKRTPAKKTPRKKSPTIKKVCSRIISREGITSDGKLKPGYRWRKGGGSAIKVKPKVAKKPAAKKKAPAKKKK